MFKTKIRLWYSAIAEYEKTASKLNKEIKTTLKKKKLTNAQVLQTMDAFRMY